MSKPTGEGLRPPWSLLAGVLFDSGDLLVGRPPSTTPPPPKRGGAGLGSTVRGDDPRLGVLTENWPSVEIAYQRLGLRPLFHAFVISSQEGRLKDDPELFAIAAARMGLPAEALLFVDDWPRTSRPPSRPASRAPSSIATRRRPPLPGSGI
jgi:hypothetical protein